MKQVLPEVVAMLPNDDTGTDLPNEVTASLCHILTNLSQSDRQNVRAIVNEGALPKILNISNKDNGLVFTTLFPFQEKRTHPDTKPPLTSDVEENNSCF